jgi:hypothetical protein
VACYDENEHTASATVTGSSEEVVWYASETGTETSTAPSRIAVGTTTAYASSKNTSTDCESSTRTAVSVTINELLTIDSISSSSGKQLIYNESTDLTVKGVKGGVEPYIYTWYRKTESETAWTEISGTDSILAAINLIETTCYMVEVKSGNPLLVCNTATASICIEVSRVELALEFTDDVYSVCNSAMDSISLRITNSKPGLATGVLVEFKTEGALPSISSVLIDSIPGNSVATTVIYLPENTGENALSGLIKAEIISCDQDDANSSTHYGNWKDERNWEGEPQEPDEAVLNLTIYPNIRLVSKLKDTICSGETFTYIPESNLPSVKFSWIRYSVPGVDMLYSSGTGEISELLTSSYDIPVTVTYTITLETEYCSSYITTDVEVIVLPKGKLTLNHTPEDGSRIVLGTPVTVTATLDGAYTNEYIFRYLGEVKKQSNNWIDIYSFSNNVLNEVEVQVENGYGCLSTAKESFIIDYSLPNVITPNADTNRKLLSGYDLQVFNRWGSQLYRGNDGWDGRYKGIIVASGTYFYVVYVTQPDGTRLELKRSVFVKY